MPVWIWPDNLVVLYNFAGYNHPALKDAIRDEANLGVLINRSAMGQFYAKKDYVICTSSNLVDIGTLKYWVQKLLTNIGVSISGIELHDATRLISMVLA